MQADAELLRYYFAELSTLRDEGRVFARNHPHAAAALDLSDSEDQDPQVARLVESFAFLTARLRRDFENQFPLIPSALLELIYPHLAAPLPSMGVVQLHVSKGQQRALEGVTVPRDTAILARLGGGSECRFTTTAPVTLWPIEPGQASMPPANEFELPPTRRAVLSLLRLPLRCTAENRGFGDLAPPRLRFHLEGDAVTRCELYDLLTGHFVGVAVEAAADRLKLLPHVRLELRGFEPEEALLPRPPAGHDGYRLLQEYFAFPDKFMFFELAGLRPGDLGEARDAQLYLLFDDQPRTRLQFRAQTLRLNCAPVINLFRRTSEPIRLDHVRTEYLLQPDARAAATTEIHSVLAVTHAASPGPRNGMVPPYFAAGPIVEGASDLRWIARRRETSTPGLAGTETMLSFVAPDLDPMLPPYEVLFAQLLCTNRKLAREISTATKLEVEIDIPVDRVQLIANPTASIDPPLGGERLWRLVSQLTLDKLSLTGGPERLDVLHQLLGLHADIGDRTRNLRQIAGISAMTTRPVGARMSEMPWRPFVRGTEIELAMDDDAFVGASALMFANVLDRFFGLYTGVNSFVRLAVRRANQQERWKEWPHRAGSKRLL